MNRRNMATMDRLAGQFDIPGHKAYWSHTYATYSIPDYQHSIAISLFSTNPDGSLGGCVASCAYGCGRSMKAALSSVAASCLKAWEKREEEAEAENRLLSPVTIEDDGPDG